jgi:hypothetical protein
VKATAWIGVQVRLERHRVVSQGSKYCS